MCSDVVRDDLERVVARLESRLADIESAHRDASERLEELERENEALRERNEALCERLESLRATEFEDVDARLEALDERTDRVEAVAEATRKRTGVNKARLEELQSRELEKGAHLRAANVDVHEVELESTHLERLHTDTETYLRLPDAEDPLERSATELSHGDLLPIQQLARMDEDMLRSTTSSLPSRLAAKLWKARADPDVGDDPWQRGCKTVREYVKASDLKHWIRRREPGTSDTYAKKLVSRTIDSILELSRNRLAVRKKTERKNGLRYTERRLVLTVDAEIPGESAKGATELNGATREGAPVTTGVSGGN